MTTVNRTFDVQPQPSVVIDYLKDFSHAEEWDPGTESCTRTDSGPVQVGSTWHNVSKIAGVSTELDYTLESLTDDTIVLSAATRPRRRPTRSPSCRAPTVPAAG